jgi:acetyl esterase/lipase
MTLEDIKTPGGRQIWLYKPKGYTGKKIFYYIHGGAFMRGNGPWCRSIAIGLVKHWGIPVAACEYRYTPEFKYPSALDDVEDCYNYLLNELHYSPKDIFMGGESAGGTYTMALCARLRRQGRELPSALINWSAYLDLSLEGESYTKNIGVDPIFTMSLEPSIPFYLEDLSLRKDPEVSPVYSDFTDYPPTYFAVDETEIFLSDALTVSDKMHKLGIPVKAYITNGLVHVYQCEDQFLKESIDLYNDIKKFLEDNGVL